MQPPDANSAGPFPRDNFDIMKYERRLSGLISSAKRCTAAIAEENARRRRDGPERACRPRKYVAPQVAIVHAILGYLDAWRGGTHLLRASRVTLGLSGISEGDILALERRAGR